MRKLQADDIVKLMQIRREQFKSSHRKIYTIYRGINIIMLANF